MKKKLLVVVAAIFMAGGSANAQAVEQGNFIIDAYYGFPNLYRSVFEAAYANSPGQLDVKVGGIGPVGGRFEYMVADKIGVGLDVGLRNTTVDYSEEVGSDRYDYNFKTQKLGFMATFNYHFLQNADAVDAYVMFGAGYGNRTFTFESTDPNFIELEAESLIPVASRIGVGMRYFFTDNIGANLGLGFGHGGLVNAGISAKF